jgi:acyl carrier protein
MIRDANYVRDLVRRIWEKELNVAVLGLDDEFFALGGDSLNMLTMLFEVTRRLGVEMPPGELFENPSLGAFTLAVSLAVNQTHGISADTDVTGHV